MTVVIVEVTNAHVKLDWRMRKCAKPPMFPLIAIYFTRTRDLITVQKFYATRSVYATGLKKYTVPRKYLQVSYNAIF